MLNEILEKNQRLMSFLKSITIGRKTGLSIWLTSPPMLLCLPQRIPSKSIGVQFDKPQITTFMSILTSDHLFLLQYIQFIFPWNFRALYPKEFIIWRWLLLTQVPTRGNIIRYKAHKSVKKLRLNWNICCLMFPILIWLLWNEFFKI